MNIGYARVSTEMQNADRQVDALLDFGIAERDIYIDKASGKEFTRPKFQSLVGTENVSPLLRENDVLVILSIDRLGRNYQQICKWWDIITNKLKCDIVVLDMPLLDTRKKGTNDLESCFIANLTLQILSYVAEKERGSIKERQRQGIESAHKKGVRFGRPPVKIPDNFHTVIEQWKCGSITAKKAMEATELSRTTFYKLVRAEESCCANG